MSEVTTTEGDVGLGSGEPAGCPPSCLPTDGPAVSLTESQAAALVASFCPGLGLGAPASGPASLHTEALLGHGF